MRTWMAMGALVALGFFGCKVDVHTDRDTAQDVDRAQSDVRNGAEETGREIDQATGRAAEGSTKRAARWARA